MFSKNLMDRIDESVQNVLDGNQNTIHEASKKYWSGGVTEKTKWSPPEDFFTQSADKIAKGLKSASDDYQTAISRLNFYINRAGKNLSLGQKSVLEAAKTKLAGLYGEKIGD